LNRPPGFNFPSLYIRTNISRNSIVWKTLMWTNDNLKQFVTSNCSSILSEHYCYYPTYCVQSGHVLTLNCHLRNICGGNKNRMSSKMLKFGERKRKPYRLCSTNVYRMVEDLGITQKGFYSRKGIMQIYKTTISLLAHLYKL